MRGKKKDTPLSVEVENPLTPAEESDASYKEEVQQENESIDVTNAEKPEAKKPDFDFRGTVPLSVKLDPELLKPAQPEIIPDNKPPAVRIRMREDHDCSIAMRRYVLKKDQTYLVPSNVKDILNEAGLLSPL